MIKVDIISGFLGAGKTTLIKKLFSTAFNNEKIAIIENEFGEIGIDGAFLSDTGVSIKEINSGCICCSLSGNFKEALQELINNYNLQRIIIEPSGVGKLSEVINAVNGVSGVKLNILCTVVDGNKVKMYHKNFGEFYEDQINSANTIVLSKIENFSQEKLVTTCEYIKQFNPTATIITTPINEINSKILLENLEDGAELMEFLIKTLKNQYGEHHHAHHHHHEHEHHDHDCDCHEHHRHGHHECDDPNCCCHHHHADEVFDSYSSQTFKVFSEDELKNILNSFDSGKFGTILRAKGVVTAQNGWLHFDYTPGDISVRSGGADISGKVCVIGTDIDKNKIKELFGN